MAPPDLPEEPLTPDEVLPGVSLPDDDGEPESTSLAQATQDALGDKMARGLPMTVAEKARQAVALRIGGATYRKIGEMLGVSHTQAKHYVDKALKEHTNDSLEELRLVQFARLEHMLMLVWPMVNQRDMAAIHTARALMDDENKLMGVNAPAEVNVNMSGRTIIASGQKDEYIAALRQARQSLEQESTEDES